MENNGGAASTLAPPPAIVVNNSAQRLWKKGTVLGILRNIIPGAATVNNAFQRQLSDIDTTGQEATTAINENSRFDIALDSSNRIITFWDTLVTISCLYNLFAVPLLSFDDVVRFYYGIWITFNVIADIIYLGDLPFQCFISYYEHGILIRDFRAIAVKYSKSLRFAVDALAIIPTDLLLIKWKGMSILRINRLLKCYRIFVYLSNAQLKTNWPNFVVMSRVIIPIIFIFHWNACGFYALSVYYGIEDAEADSWAFSYEKIMDPLFSECNWLPWHQHCSFDESQVNGTKEDYIDEMQSYWRERMVIVNFTDLAKKYAVSFYWSSMTITTLGEQPEPDYSGQNMFEVMDTVIGILIFGAIMGSVAEIVRNANLSKRELRSDLDMAKIYMQNRAVETVVQTRVSNYFDFVISESRFFEDACRCTSLTTQLRREIRNDVLLGKFRRMEIFRNINPLFLEELASSVHQQLFAPSDFLCLAGDICREVFIVESGILAEIRGKQITRKLTAGDSYGELSLIYVPEHRFENRRYSSLLSIGFSEVHVIPVVTFRRLLGDFPELSDVFENFTRSNLAAFGLLRCEAEMDKVDDREMTTANDTDERLSEISSLCRRLDTTLEQHSTKLKISRRSLRKRVALLESHVERLNDDISEEDNVG